MKYFRPVYRCRSGGTSPFHKNSGLHVVIYYIVDFSFSTNFSFADSTVHYFTSNANWAKLENIGMKGLNSFCTGFHVARPWNFSSPYICYYQRQFTGMGLGNCEPSNCSNLQFSFFKGLLILSCIFLYHRSNCLCTPSFPPPPPNRPPFH